MLNMPAPLVLLCTREILYRIFEKTKYLIEPIEDHHCLCTWEKCFRGCDHTLKNEYLFWKMKRYINGFKKKLPKVLYGTTNFSNL